MRKLLLLLLLTQLSSFSQEIKFGKVSKEELEEKFYPLDSTANAAYLYKYRRTFYKYTKSDGFQIVNQFHERVKIYKRGGFEKANKTVSYYAPEKGKKERVSNIKGYVFNIENSKINKDKLSKKSIFNEQSSKYTAQKKITFPNIKEGTVIDLKYEIISPFSSSIDEVDFQFDIPVKKFDTRVEMPEYYSFKKKHKGYYIIQPISTKKKDNIQFSSRNRVTTDGGLGVTTSNVNYSTVQFITNIDTYKANHIPSLKDDEPYIGSIKNYRGGISYELSYTKFPNSNIEYRSTSWEDISKRIFESKNFGEQLNKTKYFKDELSVVLSNVNSPKLKISAILNFIRSKVKWNDYYGKYTEFGVKKAYKEGIGNSADINLMLTAMLREAGLNSNPVLISTRNNGAPIFPSIDGFDYVISMVEFKNNTYVLLDATEPYSEPNILPIRVLNWNGRKITKTGASSWVNLTPPKHANKDYNVSVKVDDDGLVSGLLRKKLSNLNAMLFRKMYNHVKEEEVISKMEEDYTIEIENFRFTNKTKLGKPVNQTAKFTSEDLVEGINGKLYIKPLLFLGLTNNPFKSDDRKFPVDYATPWKNTYSVSIQLPEGYSIESSPEPLAIGLPDNLGLFKFQVTPQGNKVKVQSILQFNSAIIVPQYYQTLKDFYSKVVAKQSEKIVLIKS